MTWVFGALAAVCAAALMGMTWADTREQRRKGKWDD